MMVALAKQDNRITLPLDTVIQGDCLEVMRTLPDCSVDAVVTDPPYGLGEVKDIAGLLTAWLHDEDDKPYTGKKGFMGKEWDYGVPGPRYWREVYRVLKPGAHILCFSGTRTVDLMMVALRLAGFECRDVLEWLYGSGFPKSLDISKSIDRLAPRQGMFDKFAEHFRERRQVSGLSQKQIAQYFPSKTGGMTGCVWNWENGANVPTLEQWRILQPMLHLGEEWLPLIERIEAEREVIGQGKSGKTALWNEQGTMGDYAITAPTTDAAKRYSGFGTALKPAHEPIILARKPLSESSIAENVLKWGTGGLAIDKCRVGLEGMEQHRTAGSGAIGTANGIYHSSKDPKNRKQMERAEQGLNPRYDPQGRFPSNLLLSHTIFCQQQGTKRVRNTSGQANGKEREATGSMLDGMKYHDGTTYYGKYEEVEDWLCVPECPIYQLDQQSGILHARGNKKPSIRGGGMYGHKPFIGDAGPGDTGGASRYFQCFSPDTDELDQIVPFKYSSKASRRERNAGCEGLPERPGGSTAKGFTQDVANGIDRNRPTTNNHPTVKSQQLMRWLVRLVTPPDGIVLDPFAGSGSTLCACVYEGFHFVGIEQSEEYCAIAEARITYAQREAMV